jgi:hypothetical protein
MTTMSSTAKPARVLVIGDGYAGLSVIINLLNLGVGNPQIPCPLPPPELKAVPQVPAQITLIDERDGICAS